MRALAPGQFHEFTRSLVGLRVTLPWRGHGSALFLELGRLAPVQGKTRRTGEACVMIEWSWRVEKERSIAFGSWSGERKMNSGIESLKGRKIVDVALVGRLPEISVQLSGGFWLQSYMTAEGKPEWSVRVADGSWIYCEAGRIVRDSPKRPNKAPEPNGAKLSRFISERAREK